MKMGEYGLWFWEDNLRAPLEDTPRGHLEGTPREYPRRHLLEDTLEGTPRPRGYPGGHP
jgi:hypothetical protein